LGDLKEGRAEVELAVCGDSLVSWNSFMVAAAVCVLWLFVLFCWLIWLSCKLTQCWFHLLEFDLISLFSKLKTSF
jgi:hypothetical protein